MKTDNQILTILFEDKQNRAKLLQLTEEKRLECRICANRTDQGRLEVTISFPPEWLADIIA